MIYYKSFIILLGGISLLAACTSASPELPSTPAPEPTAIILVQIATKPHVRTSTALPSHNPEPSRTPKPSPTLPAGDDFTCLPENGTRVSAVVAGVTDGDTITVQVGLQNFTVRYIGVDTPETNVQPPERMGPEASRRNRELVSGERVTLVSDPGVGETDRYNRLLRYVIKDDIFINAVMVREGLARYYASPNAACGSLFFDAENEARSAHTGLWAP